MATTNQNTEQPLVLVSPSRGVEVISEKGTLARLNYFDGKLLRAGDLTIEQQYLRRIAALSNIAGSAGVVHGLDTWLAQNGTIHFGEGMAIDYEGRVLLLPQSFEVGIKDLIERTEAKPQAAADGAANGPAAFVPCGLETPGNGVAGTPVTGIYVITIGWTAAYCGVEDVYGKPCEDACVSTTDRPYLIEGVVLRAVRLLKLRQLVDSAAFPLGPAHLRSRVASAYFADEAAAIPSTISGPGLRQKTFCVGARLPGTIPEAGSDVPLALVAYNGTVIHFLDAWSARREALEAPAKRYWAYRMRMRPWDVFLAQVCQFQCQLVDVLLAPSSASEADPCADQRGLLAKAAEAMDSLKGFAAEMVKLGLLKDQKQIADLAAELTKASKAKTTAQTGAGDHTLLHGGIAEIPSAGYVPVDPTLTVSVNDQVRRLMGNGLDLRFCVTTVDYVAHALEEAQHMDRISLTWGLDHPDDKPEVDVLVPEGEILEHAAELGGGFEVQSKVSIQDVTQIAMVLYAVLGGEDTKRPEDIDTDTETDTETKDDKDKDRPPAEPAQTAKATAERAEAPAKPVTRLWSKSSQVKSSQIRMPNLAARATPEVLLEGAARGGRSPSGGGEVSLAAFGEIADLDNNVHAAHLWTRLSCDRDPFAIGYAGLASVHVDFKIAPWGFLSLAELALYATLSVTGPIRNEQGEQRLRAHVSGQLSWKYEDVRDGTLKSGGLTVELPVDLRRSGTANSSSFAIALLNENIPVSIVKASWGDSDSGVAVEVTWEVPPDIESSDEPKLLVGLMKMTESTAIFQSDNVNHARAVKAIDRIATELVGKGGGPTFKMSAERSLFGDPPEETAELIVRPTLDWVLFHRRRAKTCAPPKAAAPVPVRRFQLLHVLLDSTDRLDELIKTVQSGLWDPSFGQPAPVAEVSFEGGSSVLQSNILAAWTAASPGSSIVYGAVAPVDHSTPELDQKRLVSVAQACAPASTSSTDPKAVYEALSSTPPDDVLLGTDGAMLLVTVGESEKVVHRVAALSLEPSVLKSAIEEASDPAELYEYLLKSVVKDFEPVTFKMSVTTLLDPDEVYEDLRTQIIDTLGNVGNALVFWRKGAEPLSETSMHVLQKKRAENLLIKVDTWSGQQRFSTASESLPPEDDGHTAVIFLTPGGEAKPPRTDEGLVTVEVYAYAGTPNQLKALATAYGTRNVNLELSKQFQKLGTVAFSVKLTSILKETSDLAEIKGQLSKMKFNDAYAALIWRKDGEVDATEALYDERLEAIRDELDLKYKQHTIKSSEKGPNDCNAILFLAALK